MKMYINFAVIVLLTIFGTTTCQFYPGGPEEYTEEAAQFLLKTIDGLYWQQVPGYRHSSDDAVSPKLLMREKLRPFYAPMKRFDWKNFQNPLLKRQFQLLLRGDNYTPIDRNFTHATRVLKSMPRQKWVCPMTNSTKCNMAYIPHIKSIMTNSQSLDEMKYYWLEWRNKMPIEVKEAFKYYVDYYKYKVSTNSTPSARWYEDYDDADFMSKLDGLMEAILPFYKELHSYLRNQLVLQYGADALPKNGLLPYTLVEQANYQSWKKDSVFKNPFPDRRLPNLQAEIDTSLRQPFDLINASLQFFESMGFKKLDNEFLHNNFSLLKGNAAGSDCKSKIFDFGEIELNYCPKVHYKKLLQTHGDIAIVEYALFKNKLPVPLNQEACPGFSNAIGEAVILSASNPKHLQKHLGLLKTYDYDDLLNLNRLYRLAVHTMLTLPTYYVHEKLWVDIIDGKITPAEYNCHYWNLMQKYMGVEAPAQTDVTAYDMPYKFYEGLLDETRSTKKLFGEFFGYQIYRNICLQIGEYQRGNAYKTLDNCDFTNSTLAGQYLGQVMGAGATKPWLDIVKEFSPTGKARLSATAFIEYFQPVYNWLSDDNISKGLIPGWAESNKCQ